MHSTLLARRRQLTQSVSLARLDFANYRPKLDKEVLDFFFDFSVKIPDKTGV